MQYGCAQKLKGKRLKKGLLIIASLTVIVAILGGIWWIFLASDEPDDEPMAAAKVAPSIQGYIVDSTGRPIAGARAEIIVENGEARHIETDTDGSFRFDDLTVGTYQISAQAEGFVAGGPPGSKTVEVKLSAAENASSLRDLRLLLQRVGTIRGRVVASGKPVADATVGIYYRSEEHTSELQSRPHLVCRLLLEKKKTKSKRISPTRTPPTPTPAARTSERWSSSRPTRLALSGQTRIPWAATMSATASR